MLSHRAKITVSNHALITRPDALRQRRHQVGTHWRRLSVGRQALLVLAHLRKGETYADLAAGFGIGTTTVFRYIREAVEVLAALASSLADWRAFVSAPVPYDQGVARVPACLALVVGLSLVSGYRQ